jgi:glutathione S-transferase
MADVRIHGFLLSTWVRTACMTCVEKGVDYELVPLNRGSAEHAAMHPFTRMPVLEHDGRFVIEALAVVGYIDEAFDGPALQPDDLGGRTRMREWLSLGADYVYREVVRTVPRDRTPTEQELQTARAVLERVDARLDCQPFILADRITLADLYLAPQVSNAREKAPELLESLNAIDRWAAVMAERESFKRTSYDAAALRRG